jgi:hypothetical protein
MLPSISLTGPSSIQLDSLPKQQNDSGNPSSGNLPKDTVTAAQRNALGRLRGLQLQRQQALKNMKETIQKALNFAMTSPNMDDKKKYGLGLHKDWNAIEDPGKSLENARGTLTYLKSLGLSGEVIDNAQNAITKYCSVAADQKPEETRPHAEEQKAIEENYLKQRDQFKAPDYSYLDYGNPNPNPNVPLQSQTIVPDIRHQPHTDELFDAVSKALDSAEQSLTDTKLETEIQQYRAKLNKNCGPKEAQEQAQGAQRIVEQLGPFGADITNALNEAIAKHSSAMANLATSNSEQPKDTSLPPPNQDEHRPPDPRSTTGGASRLQNSLRSMLKQLQVMSPAADVNTPQAQLQASLKASLDSMLLEMGPVLEPDEKSEIEAHLQRLNSNGGPEPTPEQLSETLGFVREVTQQLAVDLKKSFEEALAEIPDQEQREKIRQELAPELAQLEAVAQGTPLYPPPPLPPPPKGNDQTPPKSSLNESGGSSGSDETNDKLKATEDKLKMMEKHTKMLKEVDAAEETFVALQMMLKFAKKARDFALSLI